MQAWALQRVLHSLGHEAVTMDRRMAPPTKIYRFGRAMYRAMMSAAGLRRGGFAAGGRLKSLLKQNMEFVRTHIRTSEPIYSGRQLKAHFNGNHYDAVVVGSDQTWRPAYSPDIYNFFLDFLDNSNVLRISYAASFGVDRWEYSAEQTRRCASLARKFHALSVREESGIKLCREFLGVSAEHVLDPALLLEWDDYRSLLPPEGSSNADHGVLTYFLDETNEKAEFANRIARKLGQRVRSFRSPHSVAAERSHSTCMPSTSVLEWLQALDRASFVLTDSFHGLAFALLSKKPFFVVANPERGAARVESLLKLCGLSSRLMAESTIRVASVPDDCLSVDLAYVARLAEARQRSLQFLHNALGS